MIRSVSGIVAAAVLAAGALAVPVAAATSTSITVSGTATGRTFDGIGAISGGGGNSRLLMDYPQAQRDQILDYLFKPGYGADLQILKVEIGGDTNSTDGSESSIEHTGGTVNCSTGYEWWLMEQAKQRDPSIKLYGLAWGAPGWIGGGNFWSTDMVNYLVSWLGCAKSHGLTIDYLGGWNERGYDIGWYESLRSALNANGYGAVQVVGADSDWSVANDIQSDPTFAKSVQIIGAHYPCNGGDGGDATTCSTTSNALASGKPLWASENGSQDDNAGAAPLIRSIVRGYTDAKFTAYLNWPLLAAIYPNLGYDTTGLMVANQPWAGNYSVGANLWATAQVTQFTQPGWQFLDSGSGYLGGSESNGAYVSLKSPNGSDYTTVLETTTATAAQTVTLSVGGGLSTGTAHVWTTNLASTNSANWFVHSADVTPVNGQVTLTLQPGTVYTVSTTTGQGKGTAAGGPQATWVCRTPTGSIRTRPDRRRRTCPIRTGRSRCGRAPAGRGSACARWRRSRRSTGTTRPTRTPRSAIWAGPTTRSRRTRTWNRPVRCSCSAGSGRSSRSRWPASTTTTSRSATRARGRSCATTPARH